MHKIKLGLYIFFFFFNKYGANDGQAYDEMKVVIGKQLGNVDSTRLLLSVGISYKEDRDQWGRRYSEAKEVNSACLLVAKKDNRKENWCFRPLPYFMVTNLDNMEDCLFLVHEFIRTELGYHEIILPNETLPSNCSINSQCFWTHPSIWDASYWYCDSCK